MAGRSQRGLIRLGAAVLLVALISGGVGIAEAALSSVRDYQFQVRHLELMHSYGGAVTQPGAVALGDLGGAAPLPYALYCNLRGTAANSAVTLMEYATFMVHVRAVSYTSALLLITNLVIAGVVLALLRDHLWSGQRTASLRAIIQTPLDDGVANI